MKKIVLILLCLSLPYYIMAQENVTAPKKVKEIGLVFTSLSGNFGFTFKTGNENALWRFTALSLTGNHNKNTFSNNKHTGNSINFGFNVGREYRKPIINKVYLRYGMDLGFNFSYSNSTSKTEVKKGKDYEVESKNITYSPRVNCLLGVSYLLNDKIIIGAEILPSISYTIGSSTQEQKSPNPNKKEKDFSGFGYGISNNSVTFSISYRF